MVFCSICGIRLLVPLQRLAWLGAWGDHTAQQVARIMSCYRLTRSFVPGKVVSGTISWKVLLPAPARPAPTEKGHFGCQHAPEQSLLLAQVPDISPE